MTKRLGLKEVFVFGSNEAGRHGAGAAALAYERYGAVYGCGYGHYGNSFAIPTKDFAIKTLPISRIQDYVTGFKAYTRGRPDLTFRITQIGCGLAGFFAADIAPMFVECPDNCEFDTAWAPYMRPYHMYWGTFQ